MKKVIEFLKGSNRYKNLICGAVLALVYMLLATVLSGVFQAVILTLSTTFLVASALELKDKLHKGIFDWIDVFVSLVGASLGILFFLLIYWI